MIQLALITSATQTSAVRNCRPDTCSAVEHCALTTEVAQLPLPITLPPVPALQAGNLNMELTAFNGAWRASPCTRYRQALIWC